VLTRIRSLRMEASAVAPTRFLMKLRLLYSKSAVMREAFVISLREEKKISPLE
jgi:hypothetical protein